MTFKEGDVVSHIAGCHLMTVEDIRIDDFVSVVWFDRDGIVQRDVFAPVSLQKWQKVGGEQWRA
jgi:uncharacterized protein YodC (DUF2158 family)